MRKENLLTVIPKILINSDTRKKENSCSCVQSSETLLQILGHEPIRDQVYFCLQWDVKVGLWKRDLDQIPKY